jgi:hypothetical protein
MIDDINAELAKRRYPATITALPADHYLITYTEGALRYERTIRADRPEELTHDALLWHALDTVVAGARWCHSCRREDGLSILDAHGRH